MYSISDVNSQRPLPVASFPVWVRELCVKVPAGFPSPAEDTCAKRIDLTAQLVTHPDATYLLKADGTSMTDAGIQNGDVLLVNRAIQPRHGHIVVAVLDGEFTVKTLYMRAGRVKLKAANPAFTDIGLAPIPRTV